MHKKYIVRLTEEERRTCDATVDKLKGSSQKARRARILRQVDVDGPGWTDRQVAEAYRCRTRTVENVRRRCVLEGFEMALNGKQRSLPMTHNGLDKRVAAMSQLEHVPAEPDRPDAPSSRDPWACAGDLGRGWRCQPH